MQFLKLIKSKYIKVFLALCATFVLLTFLFSYKLLQVPSGLTIDEASFGYNAVLLSQTLRDENGRFLPVFVLSIDGGDWRQPIFQYLAASVFKVIGPSIFNLRLVSVVVASLSVILIFFLGGLMSSILLLATPVFFIHSHLALDNLIPVPFIILWLLFLKRYQTFLNFKNLIAAAAFLGIGFYGYKGIRVFVPIWIITSSVYIYLSCGKDKLLKFRSVWVYWLTLLPFFAVIPYLEFKYAGAVLNNEKLLVESIYTFIYRYLAAFDPSFLYVAGDALLYHSTGKHGMFLLASLPIFITGLIVSWKKGLFEKFVIISFFSGPLLFGLFGTIHRASRMIAEVPLYVLICTWGLSYLWIKQKKLFLSASVLTFINFFSFFHYYFFIYPNQTENIFYSLESGGEYRVLSKLAKDRNLTPYVDAAKVSTKFSSADFLRSIYFLQKPNTWDGKTQSLPEGSVVMTDNREVEDLKRLDITYKNFVFYTK